MPIVLNTAPINVKDSDGNYVTLNSFSVESMASIESRKNAAITEINTTISGIDDIITESIDDALNNELTGALPVINSSKNNAISDINTTATNATTSATSQINIAKENAIDYLNTVNKVSRVNIDGYKGPHQTITVAGITSDMILINYIVSDQSLLASDLIITTSDDEINISGNTINDTITVNLTLFFLPAGIVYPNSENQEE